jgi:hypothetical protein
MLAAAVAIWVFRLFTVVPYAAYYLLYYALREQYALLITFILFWIFGYWGVVGPLPPSLSSRPTITFRGSWRAASTAC